MTYSSSHVLALAKASLIMAKESGEISVWQDMLSRMGEEIAALRQSYPSDQPAFQCQLDTYGKNLSAGLTDDQRRFVRALADHDRLALLPEIASVFSQLAATENASPAPTSGGQSASRRIEAFGTGKAFVPTSIQLVDVPAAIESSDLLAQSICDVWGSWELDVLLNNLGRESPEGERKSFSAAAISELVFLSELNRMVRAIDLASACSLPIDDAYQQVAEGDKQLRGNDVLANLLSVQEVPLPKAENPEARRHSQTDQPPGELLQFIDLMVKLATNKVAIGLIVFVLALKLVLR